VSRYLLWLVEDVPLRLPLGTDVVIAIDTSDRVRLEELERFRSLSVSTDFSTDQD
jgi:hypothetical protein